MSDIQILLKWFITCDTCVEAGGGDNCEVQSVEEGQCANNSQETLTLEDCDNRALIVSPVSSPGEVPKVLTRKGSFDSSQHNTSTFDSLDGLRSRRKDGQH